MSTRLNGRRMHLLALLMPLLASCASIEPNAADRAQIEPVRQAAEEEIRRAFEEGEQAAAGARDAEAGDVYEQRRPLTAERAAQQAALEREIFEFLQRYRTAGPVERARLEKRAAELASEAEALSD